jgi:hypothetical protein
MKKLRKMFVVVFVSICIILFLLYLIFFKMYWPILSEDYKNKTKTITYSRILPIHRAKTKTSIYYNGKELCSEIDSLKNYSCRFSPDSNLILYINQERITNRNLTPKNYEIYDILKKKKFVFPKSYCNIPLTEEIKWENDRVVLIDKNPDLILILHINDELIERRTGWISDCVIEYFVELLHQFNNRIIENDKPFFQTKVYKYLSQPSFEYIYSLESSEWFIEMNKLGEIYNVLLNTCESNYGNLLVFKLMKKAFINNFVIIDGKVSVRKELIENNNE